MAMMVKGGQQSGRRRRRGFRGAPMAEINVTPFVDVMLVLLIIFMVAAPLLTTGVPVNLPRTEAEALPRAKTPPLAVTVDADGRVFLGEIEVGLDALVENVRRAAEARAEEAGGALDEAEQRIFVRADGAAAYGGVAQVIARLQSAGFDKVGLVTQSIDAPAPPPAAEAGDGETPPSDG